MVHTTLKIAVLAGDGIGKEIMPGCITLLRKAADYVGELNLEFKDFDAGAACYRETGNALPEVTLSGAREADAILLGAMGLPDVRYPDGTEIVPQIELRMVLDLYAGVRPIRVIPGIGSPLKDERAEKIDFVIIRESTEGLFASLGKGEVIEDTAARETLEITRATSERLFDFSFALAGRRRAAGRAGRVTCVDKANVFRAYAFFRKIFDERRRIFPDIEVDYAYVDALALNMVRRPWDLDVLVTENMFGDILSDLGAGLIGGMGMAPSADIGDDHAVFQPCHGTAPDIAGQGLANPTAMFLSGAMMLDWLAEKKKIEAAAQAAELIRKSVDEAFAQGDLMPTELGGESGTQDITEAVMTALDRAGHKYV